MSQLLPVAYKNAHTIPLTHRGEFKVAISCPWCEYKVELPIIVNVHNCRQSGPDPEARQTYITAYRYGPDLHYCAGPNRSKKGT